MSCAFFFCFVLLAFCLGQENQTTLCYQGDQDCVCDGPNSHSFTALWLLSDNVAFDVKAFKAEQQIRNLDENDVISTNNVVYGMHVSLEYFCCYSATEKAQIMEALKNFSWSPLQDLEFSHFHCNVDHKGSPIYLHAHPTQAPLFGWVRKMEAFLTARGFRVQPHKQPFHCTLARVTPQYPTDKWVLMNQNSTLGNRTLDSFWIDTVRYKAQ